MRITDKTGPQPYLPSEARYATMTYARCGQSGILLPRISLGLWHNFGHGDDLVTAQGILRQAFDLGITHFDLANNYGPPFGSAELNFGRMLKQDFAPFRDELFIASKAGFDMWPGPYGNWGSRKYLFASVDQSLARMGLDYMDVFYHHRPDPETPLRETMGALDSIVRAGKALYIGLSNYSGSLLREAIAILTELGTPCLITQNKYSMFDREVEQQVLPAVGDLDVGNIAFSPLAQGMLSDKYADGIPAGSRAAKSATYLSSSDVQAKQHKIRDLYAISQARGQSLSQMALAWNLRDPRLTSVLVGASSTDQLLHNIAALKQLSFSEDELNQIDRILTNEPE